MAGGDRIGIKEVAAAAGVSITTVSHALNGKGRLPDETRVRVREVAEALGYRPSATARSLAGGRTGILALTVARVEAMPFSLTDFDYFAQLMNGAGTAALEQGYALVLAPSAGEPDLLDRVPLDGAIVVDPVRGDPTLAHLRERGVPVVTTGREPGGPATRHGSTTTTSPARARSSTTSPRPAPAASRSSPHRRCTRTRSTARPRTATGAPPTAPSPRWRRSPAR